MEILQSKITIRGQDFTVREMTGKVGSEVRKKTGAGEPIDAFIAYKCLVDPHPGKSMGAFEEDTPQFVIREIVKEVMKLTYPEESAKVEDDETKNA